MADFEIPQNAGLQDYRNLLVQSENEIKKLAPLISQYKIDRGDARSKYDDALSDAKVAAMADHGLKANHQTMINAIANKDLKVRETKQEWLNKKAVEIKALDRLAQLQGMRDSLKAMVKSENYSY